PESFEAAQGFGVLAKLDGRTVAVGTTELASLRGLTLEEQMEKTISAYASRGLSAVGVWVNGRPVGALAFSDRVKPSARQTVSALKKMGLQVFMLTGDRAEVANAVGAKLGVDRVYAEVKPVEKAGIIKKLQLEERRVVAMVGDGINDAAALAQADVGVAMGSGSDVALEAGGLILVRNDPLGVVTGLQLARRTMSKIKQNLFWAFAYNIVLIPLAAGIFYLVAGAPLSPMVSAAAMALSSVTVVSNSLTLRRFRPNL
ncbi:MAG: HAD-IC family P-type ATPase, partial [Thermoprotei archaeon]